MKKKKILIWTGVFLAGAVIAGSLLWLHNDLGGIPLKEKVQLEYGIPLEIGKEDVFAEERLGTITDFQADLSVIPRDEKGHFQFGTYPLPLTYVEDGVQKKKTIPLEVTDTLPPVLHIPQSIEIGADQTDFDYSSVIEVSDNDACTLIVDDKAVDYGVPGSYAIRIQALDDSQNAAATMATVTIVPQAQQDLENQDPGQEEDDDLKPYSAQGIVLVNKKHGLSSTYAPGEDPTAAAALGQMIADMQAAGLDISSQYSGYRSYAYQEELYNNYVNAHGQEAADTFSARPGFSEHQTGLAFDLKHQDGTLVSREAEAAWIAQHAHEYGFIVRYKDGWRETTGYVGEPWHIRYIGDEASDIYETGLSLEEYLQEEGGDYTQ